MNWKRFGRSLYNVRYYIDISMEKIMENLTRDSSVASPECKSKPLPPEGTYSVKICFIKSYFAE
jgi:hypothetical protein